jgi:hypothetical protein
MRFQTIILCEASLILAPSKECIEGEVSGSCARAWLRPLRHAAHATFLLTWEAFGAAI